MGTFEPEFPRSRSDDSPICANIDETLTAAIITEQGGKVTRTCSASSFEPGTSSAGTKAPPTLEPKLKTTIRRDLEQQLNGSETPKDVSKRVRRLVREALDIR